jgi:succinyl-diaminopimelate desuccinylase
LSIVIDHQFVEQTLTNLVRIPSENPPGSNLKIIEFLVELAKKEGLAYQRHIVDKEREMENILIAPSEDSFHGRKIAFLAHTDTVPVGDPERWTKDPFGKDREGDILYGRGTTDMKAGATAFLAIIKAIKELEAPLPIAPVFIGTADEEVLMRGAENLLIQKDFQKPPEFAVIGEPTGLQLGVAEKGIFQTKVRAKGLAAHGARPDLGANAIDACYEIIENIRATMPTEPDQLGAPTMSLGVIRGGTKINVVADFCEAELDFRFGPSYTPGTMESIVEKACTILQNPREGAYEEIHRLPALETQIDHPFIQNLSKELEALGKEPKITGLTYATDAAIAIPAWEIPFLIFGPGDQEVLHVVDEWVSFQETTAAAQLLSSALITTYSN